MFCIVLDIERTDKNYIKELGVFIDGKFQGYSFRTPRKYKPTKQAFWSKNEMCGTVDVWIRVSFKTFFLEL